MGQFNLLQKPGSQQRKLMKKLITWQVSNERNSDGLSSGMIDPEKKTSYGLNTRDDGLTCFSSSVEMFFMLRSPHLG